MIFILGSMKILVFIFAFNRRSYNGPMLATLFFAGLFWADPFLLKPDAPETRRWADYLLTERTADTRDALHNARYYIHDFRAIFRNEEVPEDLVWIALVESGFRTDAVSPTGATGMFQFKRIAGRAFGLKIQGNVDERLNPHASARAAAKYMRYLRDKFSSWELALAAYNLGEGDLRRTMKRHGAKHWSEVRAFVRPQTRYYIPKIRAAAIIGNRFVHQNPLDSQQKRHVYAVRRGDTLYGIAKKFNTTLEELVALNDLKDHQIRPGRHLILPSK